MNSSTTQSTNNKGYLYLWSGADYNSFNGPGMGPNFWPKSDGSSNASHYVWSSGQLDKHYWDAMPEAIKLSDRGEWVTLVFHYKYASSANNDGIAEIWRSYSGGPSEKILNIQNGEWYVQGQTGFTHGYILGWANSPFTEDTYFYVDNVKFSTSSLLVE